MPHQHEAKKRGKRLYFKASTCPATARAGRSRLGADFVESTGLKWFHVRMMRGVVGCGGVGGGACCNLNDIYFNCDQSLPLHVLEDATWDATPSLDNPIVPSLTEFPLMLVVRRDRQIQ